MRNTSRLPALLAIIVFAIACGDDTSLPFDGGPTMDGGPTGDAPAFDSGPTGELDCPGIFDCVGLCADGDDPCIEACVARGTDESVALVSDVVTCAEANSCADETCLAANCGAELSACAGAAPGCETAGVPEMTGPITGLQASYIAGDPMRIGVPVDEDTVRVSAGIYEVGSNLYLGGDAEDGSGTVMLDLFASVRNGSTGTFYISVQLCSTTICTLPMIRNTYQRVDREAPYSPGETYAYTRENVGGAPFMETCDTAIPVQTFEIN